MINEICAGNDSVLVDEAGEFDDWIELYNAGEVAVDLQDWQLLPSLEAELDDAWVLPAGTLLEAGGHLVLWADASPEQGSLHGPFRLASSGEFLALRSPDGQLSDSVEFPPVADDLVFGRFGDGQPFWSPSIRATPGESNPTDPGLSRDRSDVLFPADEVLQIELFLDEENHQALLADTDAHVEASLAFEGAWFPRVGLSIKGGLGSRRPLTSKAAFRVDLDEFVPGLRLRGQENLTLNNMVQDPSAVGELLSYRLSRELGVPAPRVAHAAVYLNDEFRGLYLNVESPDDQFIKRWFEDSGGNLYEGAYGADVVVGAVDALDHDEQGPDDVTDRSDLAELVSLLSGPLDGIDPAAFEAAFELEGLARLLAVEVLTGHWDGYFYAPNNFRLYHEPSTDRWTLLPWGTDQTFRSVLPIDNAAGRIAQACLALERCSSRYHLALWETALLLDSYPVETWLPEVRARVLPYFEADPYREATPQQMTDGVDWTIAYAQSHPGDILSVLFPEGIP